LAVAVASQPLSYAEALPHKRLPKHHENRKAVINRKAMTAASRG